MPGARCLQVLWQKNCAIGADLVVIDIPVGPNTKVANLPEGRKLAREFIELGERLNIRVECAVTYGGSPVGRADRSATSK